MNMTSISTSSFRNALITAGLATVLGVGATVVASNDAAVPQAHSDSIGTAVTDTAITAKVKAKLMGEHVLLKNAEADAMDNHESVDQHEAVV